MSKRDSSPRRESGQRLRSVVEIPAEPLEVFALWLDLERLPSILDGVRRVKRIGQQRVLWDVDIAGRQLLWEAEITNVEPGKRLAWESRSGTPNCGEIRFERIARGQTRVDVDIVFQPRGWLERIGARLGLVRRSVEADLLRFRRFVDAFTQQRVEGDRIHHAH